MDPTLRSTFAAEVRLSATETLVKRLRMCACRGGWSTTGMLPQHRCMLLTWATPKRQTTSVSVLRSRW